MVIMCRGILLNLNTICEEPFPSRREKLAIVVVSAYITRSIKQQARISISQEIEVSSSSGECVGIVVDGIREYGSQGSLYVVHIGVFEAKVVNVDEVVHIVVLGERNNRDPPDEQSPEMNTKAREYTATKNRDKSASSRIGTRGREPQEVASKNL